MYKPTLESLKTAANNSFLVRRFNEKAFSAPYHYHPELELTLIEKGTGKRYVGSNMSPFIAGDLVLLGPDLPHCWKLENREKRKKNSASSVVVQFAETALGERFFDNKEMSGIQKMLRRSRQGIHFTATSAQKAGDQLIALDKEQHPFR